MYDDEGNVYRGEYFNGQIQGEVKEYDYYGKLIFDGEYLNGKKWKGKIYNPKDNNMKSNLLLFIIIKIKI